MIYLSYILFFNNFDFRAGYRRTVYNTIKINTWFNLSSNILLLKEEPE